MFKQILYSLRNDGIDTNVFVCKHGLLFYPHPMDVEVLDVEKMVSISTFSLSIFLLFMFFVKLIA
jgi:hypothetical protein